MGTLVRDVEQLIARVSIWVREKSQQTGPATLEITPETDLFGTGVLDSMAFIELVVFIEENTGVAVDLIDIEPEQFTNIRGLCQFALRNASAG
jgi:acyl carrier protein